MKKIKTMSYDYARQQIKNTTGTFLRIKCARCSTEIESRKFVQTGVISFSTFITEVNWSEMMVLIEERLFKA